MAGGWFGRKPAANQAVRAKIGQWAAAALGNDPAICFSVNEIICRDPSCPGTETVILVMAPGKKTRAVKLDGEMAGIGEAEVRAALECDVQAAPGVAPE